MRKRLLCQFLPKPDHPVILTEKEARHALKVFRLKDGASIEAIDGAGHQAVVTLRTRDGSPWIEFREPDRTEPPLRGHSLTLPFGLEVAILKGEAMEWVVEKAVELGACELIPLVTDHTVIQVKNKGPHFFQERWQKIADQSLKQCGRLNRMLIHLPISLEDRLREMGTGPLTAKSQCIRLWCDELAHSRPPSEKLAPFLATYLDSIPEVFSRQKASEPLIGADPSSTKTEMKTEILTLIGPEGGWSSNERALMERQNQTVRIHLGSLILRSETAAIYSMSLLNAAFQKAF